MKEVYVEASLGISQSTAILLLRELVDYGVLVKKGKTCATLKTGGSATYIVFIGEGKTACHPLLEGRASRDNHCWVRKCGVSFYQQHFRAQLNAGCVRPLSDNSAFLTNIILYDQEMGLSMKVDGRKAELI